MLGECEVMTNGKVRLFLAMTLAACMVGCDGATNYDENRMPPAANVAPRAEWTAHEATQILNAERAFDGNRSSAATTSSSYRGAALTIDLGKECMFNMIVIYHGNDEMGFVSRITVSTSMDGKTFVKRFDGPGTRRVSTFLLVRPVVGRYVRLQVVHPGQRPWSIAEIYIR